MFKNFFEAKKLRIEKINAAREGYVNFLEISNSFGWQAYQSEVDKKIENIVKRMTENSDLTGEDLKRLQLALAVWREVNRIPKILEDKAKQK